MLGRTSARARARGFRGSPVVHDGGVMGSLRRAVGSASRELSTRTAASTPSRATTYRWRSSERSFSPSDGSASTPARRLAGSDLRIGVIARIRCWLGRQAGSRRAVHVAQYGKPDPDMRDGPRRCWWPSPRRDPAAAPASIVFVAMTPMRRSEPASVEPALKPNHPKARMERSDQRHRDVVARDGVDAAVRVVFPATRTNSAAQRNAINAARHVHDGGSREIHVPVPEPEVLAEHARATRRPRSSWRRSDR